jgi:class 3 adenylate cyclase
MNGDIAAASYLVPPATRHSAKTLVVVNGAESGAAFTFFNRIEIGRHKEGRDAPGLLLVKDPTVSSRHCVITQEPDGRCFVRDTSRNGTRLDGRRLSPNLVTELKIGQILSIGKKLELRLEGEGPETTIPGYELEPEQGTVGVADSVPVTVLVGDIRDYTVLVQQAAASEVQASVGRVFERLEQTVVELGGTLKEFQGDAIFAFWENGSTKHHAVDACRAALVLNRFVEELAHDDSVWKVDGFPLHMDWALATGLVTISGYGSEGALGLSMVGETVVLAFRIEKFADASTGPIIACPVTRMMASDCFEFNNLGTRKAKGFGHSHELFSLVKEKKSDSV